MIWQGSVEELNLFMQGINSGGRNIRITFQWSSRQIEFLDVLIRKDDDGFLQSNLYRKPTSTNMLLHATSAHPQFMIRSVPVGQFLRLRRICSTDVDFEQQAQILRARFKERGYSGRIIKKAYHRAKHSSRNSLLYSQPKSELNEKIRFVTNYCAQIPDIRDCLEKAWPILQADPTLSKIVPEKISITMRRNKNLRDHLIRSHYESNRRDPTFLGNFKPNVKMGCFPCGGCVACPNICRESTFTDAKNVKTYEIRKYITCNSRAVIYYATCPCPKIYIGLTTRQLKVRTREHILGIEAARNATNIEDLKTLPRHFAMFHSCNGGSLKVKGIDQIDLGLRGGEISRRLAQLEARWIYTLGTVCPSGLNENISFASFL
ncbi:uncharacterized protein ACNLHF_018048 [Anomaloglossus baeobatrachus]